jgi:hypothetical protein
MSNGHNKTLVESFFRQGSKSKSNSIEPQPSSTSVLSTGVLSIEYWGCAALRQAAQPGSNGPLGIFFFRQVRFRRGSRFKQSNPSSNRADHAQSEPIAVSNQAQMKPGAQSGSNARLNALPRPLFEFPSLFLANHDDERIRTQNRMQCNTPTPPQQSASTPLSVIRIGVQSSSRIQFRFKWSSWRRIQLTFHN